MRTYKSSELTKDMDSQKFIDWLIIAVYKVKNDAALSRALDMEPAHMSRIRNGKLPIPAHMLIQVHEETEIPIKQIVAMNTKEVTA